MPDISTIIIFIAQTIIGLLGLSLLVFIHEGGHFLMAKKMGVKVHTFSIGFGKSLISFKRGDTEYCLKAIPFGGFVAMAGEQPEEEKTGEPDEFGSKSIWARMAIALAGPAVNIIFAFIILSMLYMVGIEEPVKDEFVVKTVKKESPAEIAGIQSGDKIISVNEKKFSGFQDFQMKISTRVDDAIPITLVRMTDTLTLSVTPKLTDLGIGQIGIWPETKVIVSKIHKDTPAEKSGMKKDDQIISVDGSNVYDRDMFVTLVEGSEGKSLNVMVLREEKEKLLTMSPEFNESANGFKVGASIYSHYSHFKINRYSLGGALAKSYETNMEFSTAVFVILKKLFQGKIPMSSLSGPVGIVQAIGNTFRHDVRKFVEFLALISLNLGIFNLLPLIITDGGLILFLLLEGLRRKPLSLKAQMRINQVAVMFFIMLAVFISYYDILKLPDFMR